MEAVMIENREIISLTDARLAASVLSSLLSERRFSDFRAESEKIAPFDLAVIYEETDEKIRPAFFRLLTKETAAETFVELTPVLQRALVESFTDRELSELISELYIDDTVDLIEEMPAAIVKRILRASQRADRDRINRILKYPKNSAGAIMTTEYMRLFRDMTVKTALIHIRRVAIDKETIYTSYVTDSKRRLIGVVTAKKLLLSEPETEISEIMQERVISVKTTDGREYVAEKFSRYGFIALPVVDNEGRLVGIVTVDDAMTVLREEREEDFAKMAAVTPSERPYVKASPISVFKARIPWLLMLMISAALSSTILNRFEALLPTVLVLFVPMLMDTGGNSGGQVSVTVIRSISLGEIDKGMLPRILLKEIAVGLLCGITLGAIAFGKVIAVDRIIMNNAEVSIPVAAAVSVSLAATVVIAKIIGCILPIGAKGIGLDPAVMASPFITTLVDAIALVLYFFIASAFVGMA